MKMINDNSRIQSVMNAIENNTDYSLIEKLEFVNDFKKESEFKNFILLILVLIEKSKWSETVTTLLLKKIYDQKIFQKELTEEEYGIFLLKIIIEKSISPYIGISTGIRRMISSIIYDVTGQDSQHISEITSKEKLISTNEIFLKKYLDEFPIDNFAMSLFYNCIENIHSETSQITLSKESIGLIRSKIEISDLIPYLHIFIRPLYTSHSANFEGASFHVPEPFYLQIFSNNENFMDNLKLAFDKVGTKDQILVKEILKFMEAYNQNVIKGLKFVDITKTSLAKGLHINARLESA